MTETAWLEELFSAIDAKDADAFAQFLTPDAGFRFGNAEEVRGRDAIRESVAGFFESIKGLEHSVHHAWRDADRVACSGEVTYTRHDGSRITLPFADVFEMSGGRIRRYLIYMDVGPLYAAA